MKTIKTILICSVAILLILFACNSPETQQCSTELQFYPETYKENPELSSPCKLHDETELVVIQTKDNQFAIVPVTVENGELRNYDKSLWGKGNQMELACKDFPSLAKKGLHSEKELKKTKTITGLDVAEITKIGRPGKSSFEGFLAEDEDIISVLNSDNKLVNQLDFTHPDLAKPLFHIFNLILEHRIHFVGRARVFDDVKYVFYNGYKLNVTWGGDKGFQTSIFNDGNLGYYWIKIHRELTGEELNYLKKNYSNLSKEQFQKLIEKLSGFNTGEMVPFYIMRYGFYEGHTGYRADPISVVFVFGLKSLAEIDKAFSHKLPEFLKI